MALLGFGILNPQLLATPRTRNQRKKLMKKNLSQKNFKTAFSLLELSVVILIISILIAGSMTASVTAMNNAKYKVTRDRINEIYKAMGGYLLSNKALPCPASLTEIKSSSTGYGVAGSAGACTDLSGVYANSGATIVYYGMVPTQDLKLNSEMAEDGFGNKFTYIVTKSLTDTTDTDGFGAASKVGNLVVKESLGTSEINNTTDAAFVIISHGANKIGAFNNNAATQNVSPVGTADEQKNYGSISGAVVTLGSNFVSAAPNSDSFDDVLFYKNKNMVLLDFNALSLVSCAQDTTNENCDTAITGACIAKISKFGATCQARFFCKTSGAQRFTMT